VTINAPSKNVTTLLMPPGAIGVLRELCPEAEGAQGSGECPVVAIDSWVEPDAVNLALFRSHSSTQAIGRKGAEDEDDSGTKTT
jgi:hypothetical protein